MAKQPKQLKQVKQPKRAAAELKKLTATVASLQDQLTRAEERTARWKAEAKKLAAEAVKKDKKLKKLSKARRAPDAAPSTAATGVAAPVIPAGPDDSWSVARLREAARDAEIIGYSRMTKPALLAALREAR